MPNVAWAGFYPVNHLYLFRVSRPLTPSTSWFHWTYIANDTEIWILDCVLGFHNYHGSAFEFGYSFNKSQGDYVAS